MPVDGSVRLPLYRSPGQQVIGYTILDAADAERFGRHRWRLHEEGYALRYGGGDGHTRIWLHREVLGLPRAYDGREGDHINRDRLDNRRTNLRVVLHDQQGQNRSPARGSRSGFRGVHYHAPSRRWAATVRTGRRRVHLGYYATAEEAAAAAREARLRLLPFAVD